MAAISTPCIRLCVVDEATGLCAGCGRTLDEIGGWSRMSEDERRAVMAALPARLRVGPRDRDAPRPEAGP